MNFFANPRFRAAAPKPAATTVSADQPVVIEPRGPLCLSTRRNLESHLKMAIQQGHRRLVISLEHLTRFDSSGLAP